MEEVFQGLSLEMTIGRFNYEVEKVFMDRSLYLLVISAYNGENPERAKLNISDSVHVYSTDVTVVSATISEGKATLTCEIPPITHDFIRRSSLRVRTEIPVNYQYFKAIESADELSPISTPKRGVIKDLSPHGVKIDLDQDGIVFVTDYKEKTVCIKMSFELPEKNEVDHRMDILGKVASVKRGWQYDSIGVMFLTKSYQDYRLLEHYCNKNLQKQNMEDDRDFRLTITKIFQK